MDNIVKAQIEFTSGKVINLDLYPDVAPLSVANFVKLAGEGYYNGLCFHRVIPGFMIQGGGFTFEEGRLKAAKSVRPIKGEFRSNGVENPLSHKAGVISMARTMVKDSASSQFFICVDDASYLDGEYAAFGKASDDSSAAVAVEISRVPTFSAGGYDDIPKSPVVIKSVKIL